MSDAPFVDGVTSAEQQRKKSATGFGGAKTTLLVAFLTPYILYILWGVFLLSILPNTSDTYDALIPIGSLLSVVTGCFLMLIGGFLLNRVLRAKSDPVIKLFSSARIFGVFLPGLLISVLVPLFITREPMLSMQVIDPSDLSSITAPLSVTYSVEGAASILQRRGLRIEKVQWDFDGDGQQNDETIEPKVTAVYEKKGAYSVVARLLLSDGTMRRVSTRLLIPEAVFSVFPFRPILHEPVTFSVANILDSSLSITEAKWDFQSDGEFDEITTDKEVSFTYVRPGNMKVTAVISLSNQSQIQLEKFVLVGEPPPLPFPVRIETEPENLVSPAPFGVLFSIETNEPYEKIVWNLGNGKEATGERVGYTFESNGNYFVTATVYSLSGSIARLNKTVRVVDVLRLPDLSFEGSHEVRNRKVSAEVPLTVAITPKTNQPLIDFRWEVTNATEVESTDTVLRATYRRPGTYTVTLIATGPSGNVLRLPVTIEVLPQKSSVEIRMSPEGGVAPLQVRFDASETVIPDEEVTGFEWRFGSDLQGPIQGGAQIEYLFATPGTYRVFVTAFTTSGKTFSAEKTIVVRAPVLDACFTTSRVSGTAPLGVSFSLSCSTGVPESIFWDFGDGVVTDERDPIHVFERPGTYTVQLRLQDDQGTTSQESLIITAHAP